MIEFLQNYGLWIVLAGVFFAMHRFGMGCCGGGHHQRPSEPAQGVPRETPGEGLNGQKGPEPAQKTGKSCH